MIVVDDNVHEDMNKIRGKIPWKKFLVETFYTHYEKELQEIEVEESVRKEYDKKIRREIKQRCEKRRVNIAFQTDPSLMTDMED